MSFEYWSSEAHRGCHETVIVAIELYIEDVRKTGRPREYTVFEMVLNRDSVATKGPDEGQTADTLDERLRLRRFKLIGGTPRRWCFHFGA